MYSSTDSSQISEFRNYIMFHMFKGFECPEKRYINVTNYYFFIIIMFM